MRLAHPARRVISLIPSATETVVALGAADRVVGRTRYDTEPALAAVPIIGGGIDPSIEAIVALHPDLVVTWDAEPRQRVREALDRVGIPTLNIRAQDTTDVFRSIAQLGALLARNDAARTLSARLRAELADVARSVAGRPQPRVFYVVFNDPPMTAGPDTFLGQLVEVAGGTNIFADARQSWPTVSLEEVVQRRPDVIVLPYGEMRADLLARLRELPGWRDLPAVRAGRIVRVPVDLVNRPGPEIGAAARMLRDGFHPELAQ
ncbi:MAG: cobalamin-binding protein [Gemmatimonadaceae bacterium]|nr:cobalamin-binding protein [Gemmatimonadaceae bacterium]